MISELRRLGRVALICDHPHAVWWKQEAFRASDLLEKNPSSPTYLWNANNVLDHLRRNFVSEH